MHMWSKANATQRTYTHMSSFQQTIILVSYIALSALMSRAFEFYVL